MWERCGVVRTAAGLVDALDVLEVLRDAASDIDVRPTMRKDGPISPTRSTCEPASPPPKRRYAARWNAARREAPKFAGISPSSIQRWR